MLGKVPNKIRTWKEPQAFPAVSGVQLQGGEEVSERRVSSSQQTGRAKTGSTEKKKKEKNSVERKKLGKSLLATPSSKSMMKWIGCSKKNGGVCSGGKRWSSWRSRLLRQAAKEEHVEHLEMMTAVVASQISQ